MKKAKSSLIMLLMTVGISLMPTSCRITKTSVGAFEEQQGREYTYAKGKQVWLFWGLFKSSCLRSSGQCQLRK